LKALPPQEKKAAQGPIDALRPRLAALFPTDVPATQPVPQSALGHSPVGLEQTLITGPMAGLAGPNTAIEVQWGVSWFAAEILRVSGSVSLIHYTGWPSSSDEWVTAGRIRRAPTVRKVVR